MSTQQDRFRHHILVARTAWQTSHTDTLRGLASALSLARKPDDIESISTALCALIDMPGEDEETREYLSRVVDAQFRILLIE